MLRLSVVRNILENFETAIPDIRYSRENKNKMMLNTEQPLDAPVKST